MLHGASFVFEIRYLEFSEQNGAKRPSLAITRTWCFPRSAERPRSHARTWGVRGCEFAPDATSLWWCKQKSLSTCLDVSKEMKSKIGQKYQTKNHTAILAGVPSRVHAGVAHCDA